MRDVNHIRNVAFATGAWMERDESFDGDDDDDLLLLRLRIVRLSSQTMKIDAGLEMAFINGRPSIVLKGVSLWGVPVPNAWLGNLKNVDLVSQFGDQNGFWQSFAAGIETLQVENGELYIKLKE